MPLAKFNDRMLEQLADSPLSDQSRAHHRNLLLAGALSIVIAQLNLLPTRISALGVDLHSSDRHGIRIALLSAMVYFTVAFVSSAIADAAAWLERHGEARRGGEANLSNLASLRAEIDEVGPRLADDPNRTTTAWQRFEERQRELLHAETRKTLYRLLVPVDLVRALVDFVVPFGVGIAAIVFLTYGLA